MSRTFEEMAGRELDSLYQGALFLSGGAPWVAEKLLVDTLTTSFREHGRDLPDDSVERWLEGRLVQQFLAGVELGPFPVRTANEGGVPGPFDELEADTLFTAAGALPPWARAAVWLVLLRRWSYAKACGALEVDLVVLDDLLRYRDQLMTEILRSSPRGNGTDGARM
jgi:DNA-directed RNA polymerase specialized sigma24 family protein